MKKIFFFLALLYPSTAMALTGPISNKPPLRIQETDGTPACYPWRLDVSTGSLSCNSDGTATLNTGGGGGGGGNVTTCGSNPSGIQFTDSASCTWCTTVATTGNLVTSLIQCPTPSVFRGCTTGEPVGLLLSIVCTGQS